MPTIALPKHNTTLEEAKSNVIASIRDTVRHLPQERQNEIFEDFDGAVKSGNLGYLADTIANWAAGGHGYDHLGINVNDRIIASLPDIKGNPALAEIWQEYIQEQREDTDQ